MGPRKKNPPPKKSSGKISSSSSSSSSAPKLQISAENESRLRRLLLNSGARTAATPSDESLSKSQKAKKLKALYENLSCEGFNNDQIELALSALKVFYLFLRK